MPVELCAPRIAARPLPRPSEGFLLGFVLAAWGLVMIGITLFLGATPNL